jgi:hypothetical protein
MRQTHSAAPRPAICITDQHRCQYQFQRLLSSAHFDTVTWSVTGPASSVAASAAGTDTDHCYGNFQHLIGEIELSFVPPHLQRSTSAHLRPVRNCRIPPSGCRTVSIQAPSADERSIRHRRQYPALAQCAFNLPAPGFALRLFRVCRTTGNGHNQDQSVRYPHRRSFDAALDESMRPCCGADILGIC